MTNRKSKEVIRFVDVLTFNFLQKLQVNDFVSTVILFLTYYNIFLTTETVKSICSNLNNFKEGTSAGINAIKTYNLKNNQYEITQKQV